MNPAGNGDLAFRAFDRIIAFCVGRPRGISISVLQAGHLVVLACSPGSAPMVVTSSKLWMRFSYFHRCTFRAALTGTLDLASLSDDDWRQIDLDRPASEWPKLGEIAKSLVLQYAKVLDVELTDEPPDYLCGRPSKSQDIRGTELDVEHLCSAILALKGLASDIVSANWDGLIEKAVTLLPGGLPILRTYVLDDDSRAERLRGNLCKFHDCAVLARQDETTYKPQLVWRASHING